MDSQRRTCAWALRGKTSSARIRAMQLTDSFNSLRLTAMLHSYWRTSQLKPSLDRAWGAGRTARTVAPRSPSRPWAALKTHMEESTHLPSSPQALVFVNREPFLTLSIIGTKVVTTCKWTSPAWETCHWLIRELTIPWAILWQLKRWVPQACATVTHWWPTSAAWELTCKIRARLLSLLTVPLNLQIKRRNVPSRTVILYRLRLKTCQAISATTSGARSRNSANDSMKNNRRSRRSLPRSSVSRSKMCLTSKLNWGLSYVKRIRKSVKISTKDCLIKPDKNLTKNVNRRPTFNLKSWSRSTWGTRFLKSQRRNVSTNSKGMQMMRKPDRLSLSRTWLRNKNKKLYVKCKNARLQWRLSRITCSRRRSACKTSKWARKQTPIKLRSTCGLQLKRKERESKRSQLVVNASRPWWTLWVRLFVTTRKSLSWKPRKSTSNNALLGTNHND